MGVATVATARTLESKCLCRRVVAFAFVTRRFCPCPQRVFGQPLARALATPKRAAQASAAGSESPTLLDCGASPAVLSS
eukprot:2461905-Pleurochrysis_carterae.AAC.2